MIKDQAEAAIEYLLANFHEVAPRNPNGFGYETGERTAARNTVALLVMVAYGLDFDAAAEWVEEELDRRYYS